ncbi:MULTISPECIES: lysoplasmalogenase [unclassified Roseovarius]|uniref:lysoplasmalogenase n=1 Tax=unclassified Roseovarius TaxID=2614913 RepID=UPI00273E4678|nr:lysoplasmalogenase [Roseovarius sp. MMSF_3350]
MLGLVTFLGLIGLALAVFYGARQVLGAPAWGRSCVKAGSVVALAAASAACGAPWLLVAALLVSAVGDWMLSRPGDSAFLVGVAAFASAHMAYAALFLSLPEGGLNHFGAGSAVIGGALLILGLAMAVVLWPRAGALRGPVLAYLAVILCMGCAALAVPRTGALWLELPGAVLFVASDTVLAFERFVIRADHPAARGMAGFIWGSYWSAQALFTLAFCLQSFR